MIASVYEPPTDIAGYNPLRDAAGCWFDAQEALRRIKFFDLSIKHYKLQQWQRDIIATLFGWKRESDDTRRYREAFIFVPRKNGKSSMSAGLALCSFFLDKQPRGQYFCAACDLDQADLVFSMAAGVVREVPALDKQCKIRDSRKRIIRGDSFLRAIPADAAGAYGTEPHLVVGDELHLWPNRRLKDTLHTGTAALPQPLEIYITTAGFDFDTICGEVYSHACRVRDGVISDPSFLPVIYEAPKDADWKSEETWKLANPNYGVSVRKDYMEAECRKAIEEPAYENTFRREHLNQWTEQKTRWLRMDDWHKCRKSGEPIADKAQVCLGMDLSTTTDLTAVAITHRLPNGEGYKVEWRYYIAEDRAKYIEARDRVPYALWCKQGYVTATPGKTIDYSFVEADILKIADKFELLHIGYDPYNASDLSQRLINFHGLSCIELRQGVATLSAPSKELERCVIEGLIDHGDNPVAAWNASNCEVILDSNGNYKVNKANNQGAKKIDGIAALIFSIAAWQTVEESGPSIYSTPGNLAL
jgi:phage terminase large subunit-like protein